MSSAYFRPIPVPPEYRFRIHNRRDHVVVHHRGRILVWGGDVPGEQKADNVYYFDTSDYTWYYQRTTKEDLPRRMCYSAAQVVGNKLYVIGGWTGSIRDDCSNDVHFLDLNNWKWTKLEPTGKRPRKGCMMSSWLVGDTIFIFGGTGEKEEHIGRYEHNDLAAFDTTKNEWWWPQCSGQAPSPRVGHASFVDVYSKKAYVFGGKNGKSTNDLYLLDMTSWNWQELMKSSTNNDGEKGITVPRRRSSHTLTLLRPSSSSGGAVAMLYGGYYFEVLHDGTAFTDPSFGICWMLYVDSSAVPSHRWVRCLELEKGPRLHHGTVLVPDVGLLFVVGGSIHYRAPYFARRVLKLPVALPSLKQLAMNKLVEEKERVESTVRRFAPSSVQALFDAILKLKLEEEQEREEEVASLEELAEELQLWSN